MQERKKIYRPKDDRIIFGVCGGIAKYFDLDPIIIRLVFLALVFGGGSGLFIYLICALVIPSEKESNSKTENKKKEDKADEFISEVGSRFNDLGKEVNSKDWRFILGLVLILVGLSSLFSYFFSLKNLFVIFWPFVLVLIGLFILIKRK